MLHTITPLLSSIFLFCALLLILIFTLNFFLNFKVKEKKVINSVYLSIAGLLAISFLIFSIFLPDIIFPFNLSNSYTYNESGAATINNLMSPFIAIAAAILTFMAFWVQHSANNEMLINNEKQNVEKQFYEMLQIHKQNVKELQWENWTILSSSEKNVLYTNKIYSDNRYSYHQTLGCKVFELHWIEFCYIECSLINTIIYLSHNEKIIINYNNIDSWKKIVSYSYHIYMQGTSFLKNFHKETNSLKKFFNICDKDTNPFLTKIKNNQSLLSIITFSLTPLNEPLFEEDQNNLIPLYLYILLSNFKQTMQPHHVNLNYNIPYELIRGANLFSGHYDELNRYYRHLYQTVKIVANYDEKIISYEEKRKFLRMLRAQLTSKEQILLLYNWIAGPQYGEDWEKLNGNHFFTKYRMIHNIKPKQTDFFIYQNSDEVIKWIKSFYPNYKDYDENPLFEFESNQS